ncbi:hypothetical protein AB0J21_06765 [Streptomyces sp. NPDC049954]|uniref:hypothetical protein n=1 Tax=Streptomyces sp. NPDC049954 TaxID=3155779 RepID=UPI00343B3473
MATISKRISRSGTPSFRIRRLRGGRGGSWESEGFAEEGSADAFKKLVDAHGQQWPHGWAPGRGFVEPDEAPNHMPLTVWARRYVERLTGIDQRPRDDRSREVNRHRSLFVHTSPAGQRARPPSATSQPMTFRTGPESTDLVPHGPLRRGSPPHKQR